MKMAKPHMSEPSAEILNAFIDGELCSEDRLACLKQIAKEQAIGSEICDLCQVKEMVTLAYEKVPESPRHPEQRHLSRRPGRAYAAMALVLVIALAGISGLGLQQLSEHQQLASAAASDQAVQDSIKPVAQSHALSESQYLGSRIVLHLTTTDANRIYNMLDEVETLMAAAQQHGIPLQIEVIANGEGLALLRQDLSPFPQRVAALADRYAGKLVFAACQNTIDRLRREENIHVQLLPAAHVINSGVAEVIRRQTQGWAYIQI
jgi:intracellular sulfur oxidation DsrE/DsrF family protein